MFGGNLSRLFAIKCIMNTHPFAFTAVAFLTSCLILAYMMKIIEGPVYLVNIVSQSELNDYRSLSNSMWYVFITMTTVGFGDYYPKTNFGRLIGIATAIIGTFFVSIFIVYLQRTLTLSEVERTAVDFQNRLMYKDFVKKQASYFFLNTYRYNKSKQKYINQYYSAKQDKRALSKAKKELGERYYEKLAFTKSFKRLIQ